jgi:hypothetical protein
MMTERTTKRVLAIDPYSRGVGFVVLENDSLIEWGLKRTKTADNAKAVGIVASLVTRYRPDVLAVEDSNADGARRCGRVRQLLRTVASGEGKRLRVRRVRRRELLGIGPPTRTGTKYARASYIAERFPELLAVLPPFRKVYMPEDVRMAIFDAAGFALACFKTARNSAPAEGKARELSPRL